MITRLLGLTDSGVMSWLVVKPTLPPDICYCYHTLSPLVILSLRLPGHRHHWAVMKQGIKLINISALTALTLRVIHPEDAPQQYFNLTIVRTN